MERKDYILMEIEKIGLMLLGILNKLTGKEESLATKKENHFEETKAKLFNEIGFEFDKFLTLDKSESYDYISQFKGINLQNIELLAEILYQIGNNEQPEIKRIYLEKALYLLELCNLTDKTFSFDREAAISKINNSLEDLNDKND